MKTTDDEILMQAGLLFVQNGYEGTSIDMVAKKVGISQAGIFVHFKSKDELYGRSIEKIVLRLQDPGQKYELHIGSFKDFLEDYLKGVGLTMHNGRGMGITSSCYFSFLQEVSRRFPQIGRSIVEECERNEIQLIENQMKAGVIAAELKPSLEVHREAVLFRESYVGYSYFRAMEGGLTEEQALAFVQKFYNRIVQDGNKLWK